MPQMWTCGSPPGVCSAVQFFIGYAARLFQGSSQGIDETTGRRYGIKSTQMTLVPDSMRLRYEPVSDFTRVMNQVFSDSFWSSNLIEKEFLEETEYGLSRKVNIDPGYITLSKLVLASTKDFSHRIYIGKGIYAETTLRYVNGTFGAIDTTYPDYQTQLAIEFFNSCREYLKEKRYLWNQKTE